MRTVHYGDYTIVKGQAREMQNITSELKILFDPRTKWGGMGAVTVCWGYTRIPTPVLISLISRSRK